jgi:hypothetical protein
MTRHDDEIDRQLDEALRVAGPRIPEPRLRDAARARVEALIAAPAAVVARPDPTEDRLRQTVHRLRMTVAARAACLALAGTLAVFALAQMSQVVGPTVDTPRYVVVNTYSEMCPDAAEVTPVYDELRRSYRDGHVQFIELNLSEGCEQDAQGLADRLGLRCVFEEPLGGHTGVIKLVDTETGNVVIKLQAGEDQYEFESALAKLTYTDD